MFLSNPRKSFLLALFCVTLFQACGSSPGNENKPVSLNDAKSEFPFSTKEPEVYQGDFVIGDGIYEDKWFIARKGDKWRLDLYLYGEMRRSDIRTDKMYSIDHSKKIYTEIPSSNYPATDTYFFDDMTHNFFKGKEYREFEEIGRGNGIVKYKVRQAASSKEILISIDEASGIMVKQEFSSLKGQIENGSPVDFIYEVRNLKTDVDDSVFAIPDGYRKVTWDEYSPPLRRNK